MDPSPPAPEAPPARVQEAPAQLAALDALDAALLDVRRLGRRPGYRARLLSAVGDPIDASTVRVLRSVERDSERGSDDRPAGRGDGRSDGRSDGEVCVGDIAARLEIDPSTASRLVEQQVAAGYLTRGRSATDGRRATLTLTPTGRDLLAEVTRARLDLLAEITEDWSPADITALVGALDRLRAGFARLEDRHDPEGTV